MKTFVIYLLIMLPLSGFERPQDRTIKGTVTSGVDGRAIPGVNVLLKGTSRATVTDAQGQYIFQVPLSGGTLVFSFVGFERQEVRIGKEDVINVTLKAGVQSLQEVVVLGYGQTGKPYRDQLSKRLAIQGSPQYAPPPYYPTVNTEEYEGLEENIFHGAEKNPLSTFSIDVDAASYSNVRRFINNGQAVPTEAVRIEEMINYFNYSYAQPRGRKPFSVTTEISEAPWNTKHKLVHIGLQGRKIPMENLPASNLVFLIDVSGSMNQTNKLPLVKKAFALLVDQLRPEDHVSIVVYAGAAGTVLEPTAGDEKGEILAALDRLQAGGSTAGGAGLRMAYALARSHYAASGNNRVILATDGDFNVGESSNEAMEDLITDERKHGIYLTVLGFGMGNLKDAKMEILADKGNGNYAYIDNLDEARKVLVSEFAGTMYTIAKDVKLQVEFNPGRVLAYRLIGYENRKLKDEDFNNDRKDAGELGSGHTVTALYEIIPVGTRSEFYAIDGLKYQSTPTRAQSDSNDWLTVKLRYKDPGDSESQLLEAVLADEPGLVRASSDNFRWAAAVAAFGMLLTESQYLVDWDCDDVAALARGARGADDEGYRSEFVRLVRTYGLYHKTESDAGR